MFRAVVEFGIRKMKFERVPGNTLVLGQQVGMLVVAGQKPAGGPTLDPLSASSKPERGVGLRF